MRPCPTLPSATARTRRGARRRPRQGGEKAGYQEKWLLSSGLCKKREDGTLYDFYRGRVMFPIRDVTGRFIGFGGRTLKTDKKVPKYVNSPESPFYDKSRALYGIHLARNAVVREDRAILVEGYTDVMAMRQAGVEQVVASSGTALTVEQVRLLRRFSKRMTMLFDGDPAGLRAALRGVDIVLGEGLDVKVAVLPDGEDPDTFAKRLGREELMAWLEENSRDFIRFKIDLLDEDAAGRPHPTNGIGAQRGPEHCPRAGRAQADGVHPGKCPAAGHAGGGPAWPSCPPGHLPDGERGQSAAAFIDTEDGKAPSGLRGSWPRGAPRTGGRPSPPAVAVRPPHVTVEVPEVKPESTEENEPPNREGFGGAGHGRGHLGRGAHAPNWTTWPWPSVTPWWTGSSRHFREQMGEGHIPDAEDMGRDRDGRADGGPRRLGIRAQRELDQAPWHPSRNGRAEPEGGPSGGVAPADARRSPLRGARITRRLAEMAEDPSTSENPLEEEKDLLRRKMSVSSRVFKISEHFKTVILNPAKEDVGVAGSRP